MNALYFSPLLLSINLMVASALGCTALWYYSRPYRGPGVWTCGVLTLVAGLFLLLFENTSLYVLGSALQTAGEAILVVGVFRYLGLAEPWWIVPTSASLIGVAMGWHSWVAPFNGELMVALSSGLSALITALASRVLWAGPGEPELRGVRRFVALTFAGYVLVNVTSGLIAMANNLQGIEFTLETTSVSYLLPINFGIPLWALCLIGLALLTMRRILLDSQHNALAAKASAHRFERLMGVTNGGVMLLKDGHLLDANPMLETLFAQPLTELLGKPLAHLFETCDDLATQMADADSRPHDHQAIRGDGSRFAAELSVAALDDGSLVAEVRDVSQRKALEEELRQLAFRDPLTGALNRRAFAERAEQERLRSARQHRPLCLAIFDLDHFKQVNDTYGHAVGDLVLQRFAGLCRGGIRRTDHFARFGGEEFVLLLPDTNQSQASVLLERLRQHWADERLDTPLGMLQSTVSIGLVQIDDDAPLEAWLERADVALYKAKSEGRNRLVMG
ncbi:sensor domain-containing diguanylate cyclase [Pseudomonas sp. TUM22785]|uniref:sensor domain-containing diguanylate cyclase n=1 Tax=Pseudomonas sp. TUM22785 TaxID=3019098 RepID=UPI0023068D9D|nr:diguanylate cyclase [Pseudomonas sp. TUM22785]WCD77848.1 diguanylate cyclase [Pseudomonas sp. TUM22785]